MRQKSDQETMSDETTAESAAPPHRAPIIETREVREPYRGEDRRPGDDDEERRRRARAVYLIEREAIQLRRLRWQASAGDAAAIRLATEVDQMIGAGGQREAKAQSVTNAQSVANAGDGAAARLSRYGRAGRTADDDSLLTRWREKAAAMLGRMRSGS